MHEAIQEKAAELGRMLGQTDEYRALQRARERVNEDRELPPLLNRLAELESQLAHALEGGEAPPDATREAYESAFAELQSSAVYQGLVAAQANFDKVLTRVNDDISKGMEAGARSRIILPT
jgi:cell fate (sporulation/competence/biofilm development) regulator YlbF (YheA/YmcA/DUF963 family)